MENENNKEVHIKVVSDVLKFEYLTMATSFNIAHPPSYLFS